MFSSFSFEGTCQQLYYTLQSNIIKSHQICNPIQDQFDWTCGCNINYIATTSTTEENDGTSTNNNNNGAFGYWNW
jgi:hypothetical protein